ncbi:MAG: family 43 glycosylhydrolase [Clostridia bacterium]|nr:family 43 glycosylhydrolase [Clostridia bacterium]
MKRFRIAFAVLAAALLLCLCALGAAAADTVYVKDGGTGDGSSAAAPLGDLADAFAAVENGGKIVVVDSITLSTSKNYDASVPAFTAPKTSGEVTVCGDKAGAKIVCADGSRYFCTGDTVFENITFTNANKKTFVMAARFFRLTFGTGVVMDNIEFHLVGGMEHTNATLSVPGDDYSKDSYLTVRSGEIAELTGLGRNVSKSGGKANYSGKAHITIGGDASVERLFAVYRWGSKTLTTGSAEIILDGGRVNNFIALGADKVTYTCDLTVTLTGNFVPENYFTSVTPGLDKDGAFRGLSGCGCYVESAVNYGHTVLDVSAAKVDQSWLDTCVYLASFDEVRGAGGGAAPVEETSVCFVSDAGSGSGDGKSAETAVNSLGLAFKKLSAKGGKIVVCGNVTVDSSSATFPTRSDAFTITSLHGGVNYAKTAGARLLIQSDLYLGGPTKFEYVTISSASNTEIYCRGNDLTLGFGITNEYATNPLAIWGGTDCALSGTTAKSARYFGYTIEIDSGTWFFVRGGSIRTGEGQPVGTIGDVTILINGGTFTSTTTENTKNGIIGVGGFDALDGDANIIINGGSFTCDIMGIGRPGTNATVSNNAYSRGNVYITVNGGSFGRGTTIGAVHDSVASYVGGDFVLTVNGGSFAGGHKGFNADGVRGNAICEIEPSIDLPAVGFDKSVFVSDAGSDANDGLSAQTPKKTLTAAANLLGRDGGILVVCGKTSVSTETLPACDKQIRLTSVYGDTDFRKSGAVLSISGKLTFGGKADFSDLTFDGVGVLCGAGFDMKLGKGLAGGALSIDGGSGRTTHGVTVESGSFADVCGGAVTEKDATAYVVWVGGSAKNLCGASSTAANATVSVRGGSIGGDVCAVKNASTGGVEIRGGSVGGKVTGALSAQSGKVAYVRDGGSGDGTTPDKAAGTLVNAANALKNGGTIVVCGRLSVDVGQVLPDAGGKVTITSLYGGVDYRATDGAEIELRQFISFGSEGQLDHLNLVAAANGTYISAEGHKLTVGEGMNCSIFYNNRTEDYTALVGGSVALSANQSGGNTLTVRSGDFGILSAGMYSTAAGAATAKTVRGDLTLNIEGGVFHDAIYVAGQNNLVGNATLHITGGAFHCPIFGMDDAAVTVTGNITLNLDGGLFCGDIRAAVSEKPTLNGAYALNVGNADIERASSIVGAEKLGGTHTSVFNAPSVDLSAQLSGEISFQNPIAGYADPSVIYHDGWYYYTYAGNSSATKAALYIRKAANLCDLAGAAPQLIWSQVTTGEGAEMTDLWAPQFYFIDGRWYIYAAAQGQKTESGADERFPYVWIGQTDTPEGPYTYFGCMKNLDTTYMTYLSPRVVIHGGKTYMFFSGFATATDTSPHTQRLRIVELASPTEFGSKEVVFASPSYTWEGGSANATTGFSGILEGPFAFYAPNGELYIIYAGNHTRQDTYCTGILHFTGGENDSLLDPALWEKDPEPFQWVNYETGTLSPGAMVVTTSSDGAHYYGVYHAKQYHYSAYTMRRLYMQEISFDANGVPRIGDAPSIDTVLTMQKNHTPIENRISSFTTVIGGEPSAFAKTRTYADSFTDVTADKWFYPYVKTAYEYTLANGTSATKFSPDDKFTVAQALTAAVNIHKAYFGKDVDLSGGDPWYAPYVSYCIETGIIKDGQFDSYDRGITRGEMATVFANILPDEEYAAVRSGACPDVTADMTCAAAVAKLFAAGIVGGDAGTGNYRPNDNIVRSEACVIFTRIAAKQYRAK